VQGHIFQISRAEHGNLPHPFVVVLEFSGNADCLVVPAFSADGHKVNDIIQARLDEGHRLDQIAVTMDNAQYVQFDTSHTGKLAHWLVADFDRMAISDIRKYPKIGSMNAAGLKLIAAGLLSFAPCTYRLSKAAQKKLRQLAEG
jgi:hypothetical protein